MRQLLRSESGSALIEFSGFLSVAVLILAGIADYALEIQQAMQVSEAASAGAAYGAIPGNQKDSAGMTAAARAAAPAVTGLSVSVSNLFSCTPGGAAVASGATCSGYGTPIEYVVVQTSAAVPTALHYVGMPASLTLKGSASYRVPWTP